MRFLDKLKAQQLPKEITEMSSMKAFANQQE
jgi:hypothetical protein